ncbi:TPA: thioredoxin-like domain-containing protein [Elizabethkingia anophelis]
MLIFISCNALFKAQSTVIKGNIPNLPDGTLYLYQNKPSNIIDSTKTIYGKFEIKHLFKTKNAVYLGLAHLDKQQIRRLFFIPVNSKTGEASHNLQFFMSDPLIAIKGNIQDYAPPGTKLPEKLKIVTTSMINVGKQTSVLYDISPDFFDKATYGDIKETIIKYPYSFHVLYGLENLRNEFTPIQMKELLELFDKDVKQSEPFKKELLLAQKREKRGNNPILLENTSGNKTVFTESNSNKYLIVFWASWCRPCREEVPLLKKAYETKNPDLEFISISLDNDKTAWKKALDKEQMPWKQFIVSGKGDVFDDLQAVFKLKNSIPYMVLVDKNMKILTSTTGLSSEEKLKEIINK